MCAVCTGRIRGCVLVSVDLCFFFSSRRRHTRLRRDRSSDVCSSDLTVIDSLTWAGEWWPHWISAEPEGNRVVVTSGTGDTQYKVLIFKLNSETGEMEFDETFRQPGSTELGVSFSRTAWPHGAAGSAKPHGAVFSRPEFNLEN